MDSKIQLYPHQIEARDQLFSGAILRGGVGSGKTLTALAYYKKNHSKKKLIVITTAKKRDSGDWQREAGLLDISNLIVDSWNNIGEYSQLYDYFFIFDEQRVVGSGKWSKMFIKIAKENEWILLTATPGDTWLDYIPVFIANGFYKNKTQFTQEHIEYDRFAKFPKIKSFHNQERLFYYRDMITVDMSVERKTVRHHTDIVCNYDKTAVKELYSKRWNPYLDKPIETPSEFAQCNRRLVAEDDSRIRKLTYLLNVIPRVIVFYNYNYELDILISICESSNLTYAQYNGKRHDNIPDSNLWVYLVQYTAGAEGWNCVETNTIIFYSPNYSYKIMEQSEGRIDRINTQYKHLEYINLITNSKIDLAVRKAILEKRIFNESRWR